MWIECWNINSLLVQIIIKISMTTIRQGILRQALLLNRLLRKVACSFSNISNQSVKWLPSLCAITVRSQEVMLESGPGLKLFLELFFVLSESKLLFH